MVGISKNNRKNPYLLTGAGVQRLAGKIEGHGSARASRVHADTRSSEVKEPTQPVCEHTETEAEGRIRCRVLGITA
jgi:hypothetical protein